MKDSRIHLIECDGMKVAASVFSKNTEEHPIYFIANYLIYVQCGTLILNIDDQVHTVQKDEFAVVRKHASGTFSKMMDEELGCFKESVFVFHDAFIKEIIKDFSHSRFRDKPAASQIFAKLPNDPILKALMSSLGEYIRNDIKVDRTLIELKTKEAIYGLTKLKPELIHMFDEFSAPAKVDLAYFMEHNFTYNLNLEDFAELSGRSLTSFNREFRKLFSITPHKWIKQKRLELAKLLLQQTDKMASDIYLEVGFEDLSHFSRSFKSYFGYNPSTVKTKQT